MFPRVTLFLASLLLVSPLVAGEAPAQATPAPAPKPPACFLIVLRLPARLHDQKAWTKEDNAAVGAHFNRLKEAAARGEVIVAGRTQEPLNETFGLVIFTAADEAAARAFMNDDPCVKAGVMTAELHPYAVAVRGGPPH